MLLALVVSACGGESDADAPTATAQSFAAFCADLARIERLGERGTGTPADVRAFAVGSLNAAESAIENGPRALRDPLERIAIFYREYRDLAARFAFDPRRIEGAPESERFSPGTVDAAVAASAEVEAFAAERCPREYDIL